MVADHIVEVFTAVIFSRGVLGNHEFALLVVWCELRAREIAQVDGDIETARVTGRTGFRGPRFGLPDRLFERAATEFDLGPNMRIGKRPQANGSSQIFYLKRTGLFPAEVERPDAEK